MTVPTELDQRFRDAAASEGLLDVAYDVLDSPIGPLLVGVSDRGVCRISFDPEPDAELDRLAARIGPRVLRAGRRVEPVRRQLGEYFERRRQTFELDYDLRRPACVPAGGAARAGRAFATQRRRRTGRLRRGSAGRGPRGPSAARSIGTRCRSSSPATASSGRPEAWSAMPAGWSESRRS